MGEVMNSRSLDSNEISFDASRLNDDIIKLKRQRSDKISNLMGHYLLKGWRMLNESCPKCETILFQQPSGLYYCIACSEIDEDKSSPTKNSLDNQHLVNKSPNLSSESPPFRNDADISTHSLTKIVSGLPKKSTDPQRRPLSSTKQILTNEHNEINILTELREKINWCMLQLIETTSPIEIQHWVDTLKSLLDLWDKLLKCNFIKCYHEEKYSHS
ncbi:Sjoegren syndrome/scleroderma autoantigen 1 isoform 2 [Schistosoma japonicum]|uniref:Sjoegren syndrome/scleroderma autoantigen 1 isoform 2 n=3 Tax=Schistosoma japonicum TaxID=6182 RepID=A0A4Z2DTR9_SCHJA|nr:Sjoegren syndrome/scleroderma autoantigen 1 isoform 2 [Schistosoma japonicum]